jgi:hypothetical protein
MTVPTAITVLKLVARIPIRAERDFVFPDFPIARIAGGF